MTATLKINKGTAERLLEWTSIKADQSKNLTDKDLTLELDNGNVVIKRHSNGRSVLEISDFEGSFSVRIELTPENVSKIWEALK